MKRESRKSKAFSSLGYWYGSFNRSIKWLLAWLFQFRNQIIALYIDVRIIGRKHLVLTCLNHLQFVFSGWWFTSSLLLAIQSLFSLLLTLFQEVTSQSFTVPFKQDEFVLPNYNAMMNHCIVSKEVFSFGDVSEVQSNTTNCNR